MRSDTRSQRPFPWLILLAVGLMVSLAGCDRTIVQAPTGQQIATWTEPFDREALQAAMPFYRESDLSGYDFALLLVVQNYNDSDVAVTLEVNGQDAERRFVAKGTQEVFAVTDTMVRQTEAALGLSATAAEAKLQGHPCPFVVRLKDYIASDGYIIQNSDFVLAPANIFENTTLDPDIKRDSTYLIDAHIACPGAFALALREGHANVIELDRDFVSVNEEGDKGELVYAPDENNLVAEYHPETVEALTLLGLDWLLQAQ